MDKFDRVIRLHNILRTRKTAISLEALRERLECSKPTLHRAIAILRDRFDAPLIFDKNASGYRYVSESNASAFELPGLWFTAAELHALIVMQRLLKELGAGLLEEHLAPLSRRLDNLMRHRNLNLGEAVARLRFPAIAARSPGEAFQIAASATLQRKKLWFEYHARGNDRHSERTVSPQRLVHYRDAWYLDTWDDNSGELRTFSLDRISRPRMLDDSARNILDAELDEHFASGYGIFGGKADKVAVLRFDSERARWVAEETWHPSQEGRRLDDGTYELRVPYRDHRELAMDILRHGPHVRVIEPQSLRDEVKSQLTSALARYASDST
jgi:predicted DNA-binding transcriptional regulator YafY